MKARSFLAGVLCVCVFTTANADGDGIAVWEEAILQSMKAAVVDTLKGQDDIREALTPELSTAFQLWLNAYPASNKTPIDRALLAFAPAVSSAYVNTDPFAEFPSYLFKTFTPSAMSQQLFIPESAGQVPYYIGLSLSLLNAFVDKSFYERLWYRPDKAIKEFGGYFKLGQGFQALACQYIFYDLSSYLFVRHINSLIPEDKKLNKRQQRVLARYLTHRAIWLIIEAKKDYDASR